MAILFEIDHVPMDEETLIIKDEDQIDSQSVCQVLGGWVEVSVPTGVRMFI